LGFPVTIRRLSGSTGAVMNGAYGYRSYTDPKVGTGGFGYPIYHNSIWNILNVTPDPSTLNIPNGEILNFTIRRRVEADDRVIMFQQSPSGSSGIKTPSGQGYLIPKDLTATQKRNVQTMINQITAKNQNLDSTDVETTSSI